MARFNQEIAIFEKRWPDILRKGDPYYNPNLTLDSQDFAETIVSMKEAIKFKEEMRCVFWLQA